MSLWVLSSSCTIPLDRPRMVAILNLTPDSFHDGGLIQDADQAMARAEQAVEQGADALDLGGESTRPGSASVSEREQMDRVLPALAAIRRRLGVPITIDTTRAAVARAALDAGADAINDTSAGLDDPEMIPLAARRSCGMVLMHRLSKPAVDSYSDQYRRAPEYGDVVAFVRNFLADRARAALEAGVPRAGVVIDPGLGFGKSVGQNLELIRRTGEFAALGYPVVSGLSRKSFVGRAQGMDESQPANRLPGTIALSVAHFYAGARLFRVHDVGPVSQALRAAAAALPK